MDIRIWGFHDDEDDDDDVSAARFFFLPYLTYEAFRWEVWVGRCVWVVARRDLDWTLMRKGEQALAFCIYIGCLPGDSGGYFVFCLGEWGK